MMRDVGARWLISGERRAPWGNAGTLKADEPVGRDYRLRAAVTYFRPRRTKKCWSVIRAPLGFDLNTVHQRGGQEALSKYLAPSLSWKVPLSFMHPFN